MIEKSKKILLGLTTIILISCGSVDRVQFSHPLDNKLTQEEWYNEPWLECENCDEID